MGQLCRTGHSARARWRHTTAWVLSAGIALAAGACDRTEKIAGPPRPPLEPRAAVSNAGVAIERDERLALPRFEAIEVRATGRMRPGEPIDLTVSVRGAVATTDANVSVFLPEVAIWSANEWKSGRVSPNTRVPAHAAWRSSFGRGQVLQRRTAVTIPKAGIYRAVVQARAGDQEPTFVDGVAYGDVAQKEIWLEVSDRGGKAHETFPKERVAEPGKKLTAGARGGAGPDRIEAMIIQPCEERTCLEPPAQELITGFVLYMNSRTNLVTGLPRATVALMNYSGQVIRGPILTTSDGYFQFTVDRCPTEYSPYLVAAYAGNSWVAVRVGPDDPSNLINARFVYPEDCRQRNDLGAITNAQAEVFDNFNEAIVATRRTFVNLTVRSKINVRIRPDLVGGGTYYPGGDTIVVRDQGLGGAGGVYLAGHEYGHAVHEKALGGYTSYPWHPTVDRDCPTQHFSYTVSPMMCALIEGFADFHAIVTRGAANGTDRVAAVENNDWWNHPSDGAGGDVRAQRDGSLREGAVSAFLYDMLDGKGPDRTNRASEPNWYDNVQVPGDYFARVIRSCRIQHWPNNFIFGTGTWDRANGIDFLFYCFNRDRDHTRSTKEAAWTVRNAIDEFPYRTNLFETRLRGDVRFAWPTRQFPFFWTDETEYGDYPFRGGIPFPGYEWPYWQVDSRFVMSKNLFPT